MKMFTFTLILFMTVVSCTNHTASPSYYFANTPFIPLLKQKKDMIISSNVGVSAGNGEFLIRDSYIAYAVSDHFAILATESKANGDENYIDSDDFIHARRRQGELAFGFYLPYTNKNEDYSIAEFYLGSGIGKMKIDYKNTDYNNKGYNAIYEIYRGNYSKFFIQANYGIGKSYLMFGFSSRLSYINFYYFKGQLSDGSNIKRNNYSGYFSDNYFFIKTGSKNIKFYFIEGLSSKVFKKLKLPSDRFYFGLGLDVNITKLISNLTNRHR